MKNVYEKPELKFLGLKLDEILASEGDGTDLGDGPSGMGGGSDIW